jgi:hypothetical protein
LFQHGKACRQIHRRRRLSHPSLLICNCNDFSHTFPFYNIRRKSTTKKNIHPFFHPLFINKNTRFYQHPAKRHSQSEVYPHARPHNKIPAFLHRFDCLL